MGFELNKLIRPLLSGLIILPFIGSAASAVSPSISDSSNATTIQDRTAIRKNTYSVNLTTIQQNRLLGKCVAAQEVIKNIKAKDAKSAEARKAVYDKLTNKLNTMIDDLNQQKVEVGLLKISAAKFNSAVKQYNTDAATYNSAVNDSILQDCKSDVIGFEATIINARTFRTQLGKDAAAIKTASTDVTNNLESIRSSMSNGVN